MPIQRKARKLLRSFGYDVVRFVPESHPVARRRRLFEFYSIDTVVDVGANVGQYAQGLRRDVGYTKRIVSFEPLSSAFGSLSANAKSDPNWEVFNFALGNANVAQEINISGNSQSSSLLEMLPSHEAVAPESKYVGREVVQVRTLDSVFGDLYTPGSVVYLKIDAQGFEREVLAGARESLAHIVAVQLEMSLVQFYAGEVLFDEMCAVMRDRGFGLVALEDGYSDPVSAELLQVDGIFHRHAPAIDLNHAG